MVPGKFQEPWTPPVITTNPIQNPCSTSLTSEERSLVYQVLNNHKRQYETITTSSTSTIMTPLSSTGRPVQPLNHLMSMQHNSRGLDYPTGSYPSYNPNGQSPPLDLTQTLHQTNSNHQLNNNSSYHQGKLHDQSQAPPQDGSKHQDLKPNHDTSLSHSDARFDCTFCGKQFQRQAYLRKHIQCRHSEQLKPATGGPDSEHPHPAAGSLGGKIPYQTDVHQENRSEMTPGGGLHSSVTCRTCFKTFSSEMARVKHEVSAHASGGFTCTTCRQSFTSRVAMERHVRVAHVTENFPCKYCSMTFHSSPALTRHINKLHPTENRQVILLQLPVLKNRPC